MSLVIKGPFPPRKASETLRDRLLQYLTSHPVKTGDAFYSDAQLVEMTGLSRKAVRKALEDLQREGWIERVTGKGSFIGARASLPVSSTAAMPRNMRRMVRMAVLAYSMEGTVPDWYSREVIAGIDEVAGEEGIVIELMGVYTTRISHLSQRLIQSRPDVLLVMPATSRHAFLIGEAQRLNIPCVLTGTRLLDLRLPTAYEDGEQGATLAVRHLVQAGHRRIAMLQRPDSAPWVFARRQGYVRGLSECGIAHDERLVCWLTHEDSEQTVNQLRDFLAREKPTAMLLGSSWHVRILSRLIKAGELRIPETMSLISFDQIWTDYQIHLGLRPTIVELPLREMGKRTAVMAKRLAAGENVEEQCALPCTIVEGESVAPPAGS